MKKETSHRAGELKALGWIESDLSRYIELWEYRQRWGAMNLEREDRLFLRKAESELPAISIGKASTKKAIKDKTYYRWLQFHLDSMREAEISMEISEEEFGAWPMLLEVELRILDYYEPVLGLPDTLKAKAIRPIREKHALRAKDMASENNRINIYDFEKPLNVLKTKETNRWTHLREDMSADNSYPILEKSILIDFRKNVHREIHDFIRNTFPSLAETDKPEPTYI